jgi:hypothetical protein
MQCSESHPDEPTTHPPAAEPVKPTGMILHPDTVEGPPSQLPDGHADWYGYPLNMLGSGN